METASKEYQINQFEKELKRGLRLQHKKQISFTYLSAAVGIESFQRRQREAALSLFYVAESHRLIIPQRKFWTPDSRRLPFIGFSVFSFGTLLSN